MSDAPQPAWYKNPGWIAASVVLTTAVVGAIANSVHVSAESAENTRQIAMLWTRVNDVPKIYADVAAIKAHAEDEEKRLDQIDAKLDRALERAASKP